eukprot:TRINITY_DN10835_c0_g1_i1.p1 TRINITY_DN10835_c0_g1~~TRINITY_DN10835_c0_g1_i1.p1  ORF type:complete len:1066 (+),score=139.17 TRINITY_DN10835_c0_g1_i1:36-3233(+)
MRQMQCPGLAHSPAGSPVSSPQKPQRHFSGQVSPTSACTCSQPNTPTSPGPIKQFMISSPTSCGSLATGCQSQRVLPVVPAGVHTHAGLQCTARSVPAAAAPALTSRICRSPPQLRAVPAGIATIQCIAAPCQGLQRPAGGPRDVLSATWTGHANSLDSTWKSVHSEITAVQPIQSVATCPSRSPPFASASTCARSTSQESVSSDQRSFSFEASSQASLEDRRMWTIMQTIRVGSDAERQQLAGKARLFDRSMHHSVKQAIERLNKGVLQCPEGLCVIYSASSNANFLLYRADKQDAAATIAEQLGGSLNRCGEMVDTLAQAPSFVATPPRVLQDGKGSAPSPQSGSVDQTGVPRVSASRERLHRSPSLGNRPTGFAARTGSPSLQLTPTKSPVSRSSNPLPRSQQLAQATFQQRPKTSSLQQSTHKLASSDRSAGQKLERPQEADDAHRARSAVPAKPPAALSSTSLGLQSQRSAPSAITSRACSSTSPSNCVANVASGASSIAIPLVSNDTAAATPSRATSTNSKANQRSPEAALTAPTPQGSAQQARKRSPIRGSKTSSSSRPGGTGSQTGREVDIAGRRFVLSEVIGRGAFGVVWRSQERGHGSGIDVAVKVVTAKDSAGLAAATFEAELLQILTAASRSSSKHVPLYLAHNVTRTCGDNGSGVVRLAMSFVPGVPLDKWLYGISDEEHKTVDVAQLVDGHLPGGQQGSWRLLSACSAIRDQLSQMAGVFAALQPIAFHRDVSSHNVLVNFSADSGRREFALIDFGLSVRSGSWSREWRNSNLAGDPRYWTPSAWMAFAFGFRYVATHPNSGFQQQYLSRIDHFSLGILGLETLFALWNTGEAYEGKNPGLLEIRAAWVKYWIAVIHLFQMFHMQGAQEVRQFLSQSQDEGVSSLVAHLRQLRQALRMAAVNHLNVQCAALLLVLADLIDEKGTVSWSEIPTMLEEDLRAQDVASKEMPKGAPAALTSRSAATTPSDTGGRTSRALIEPQSPCRRATHTRIRSTLDADGCQLDSDVASPIVRRGAWQDVCSAQLSPASSSEVKIDMLSKSFSHRRRTSAYV